ncbi:MAG: hypothetical protein P8I56_13940 [Paracoccaceae bacterium]|jgi:hypothetical protein|nr:hypothetical protein [Paracoccaceae bacterium]
MSRQVLAAAAFMCAAATAAESQIRAEYTAAPLADQIILSNVAECPTGPLEIAIYLSGSAGELIVSGNAEAKLSLGSKVKVNDTNGNPVDVTVVEDALFLTVTNFAPGHGIELNVPLDSELDDGELQSVKSAGALIAGAEAVVSAPGDAYWVGLFGTDGQATVETPACLS